jgi:hypothetical protein
MEATPKKTRRVGEKEEKRETKKAKNDETTTVLWRKKLLEDKDFHYNSFLSSLPKEIWSFIFSFLQDRDLTALVAVSKSLYRFLLLLGSLAFLMTGRKTR